MINKQSMFHFCRSYNYPNIYHYFVYNEEVDISTPVIQEADKKL